MKFKVILFCVLVFCSQIVVPYPYEEEEVRQRVHQPNGWPVNHNAPEQYHHTNIARPQNLNPPFHHQNNRDFGRNFENYRPNNNGRMSIEERHNTYENPIDRRHQRIGQLNWRPHNQFANPILPTVPSVLPEEGRHIVHEPYRGPGENQLHPEIPFPLVKHPYRNVDRIPNFPTRQPQRHRELYREREPFLDRVFHPRIEPFHQRELHPEPYQVREEFRPVHPNIEHLVPVKHMNNFPPPKFEKPVSFESNSEAFAETGFSHEAVPNLPRFPVEHQGHTAKEIEDHLKDIIAVNHKRFVIIHPNGTVESLEKLDPATLNNPNIHKVHAGPDGTINHDHNDFHKSHPLPLPGFSITTPSPLYTSQTPKPFMDILKSNEKFHDEIITISPIEIATENVTDVPTTVNESRKIKNVTVDVTPGYDKIKPTTEEPTTRNNDFHKRTVNTTILDKLMEKYTVEHHNHPYVSKGNDDTDDVHTRNLELDHSKILTQDTDNYYNVNIKNFTLDNFAHDSDSNNSPFHSYKDFTHDNDSHDSVNSSNFTLDNSYKNFIYDSNNKTEEDSVDISTTHEQKALYTTKNNDAPVEYTASKDTSTSDNSAINATVSSHFIANKTNEDNKNLVTPATYDSVTQTDVVNNTDGGLSVTTSSPIQSDVDTTTVSPAEKALNSKQSKNVTVTLNIPADDNGDTISVSIEVPPDDADDVDKPGEKYEDETLVVKIATKPVTETSTEKPCTAKDGQKSDDNVMIDLSLSDEKPVMWVRTTDENIFDKLGSGKDKVVYFFNVRPQALIERDRTKTVHPNGTIVLDMIEKIYENKEDSTPKIVKSTQVINPGDPPPEDSIF